MASFLKLERALWQAEAERVDQELLEFSGPFFERYGAGIAQRGATTVVAKFPDIHLFVPVCECSSRCLGCGQTFRNSEPHACPTND